MAAVRIGAWYLRAFLVVQVQFPGKLPGEGNDAYLPVGSLDPVLAVCKLDIGRCAFQFVGRKRDAVLHDLMRGGKHRTAQTVQRARAAGRIGDKVEFRLRSTQADTFHRYPEHACDDLRERRFVALPVVVRGRAQGNAAIGFPGDPRLIVGRKTATCRGFDVGRDAPAAQPAARLRLLQSLRIARPIRSSQRLVDQACEIAAVVFEPCDGLVRHLRHRDQVATAELDRVQADDQRRLVDQPLEGVGGHGPSGAAIRRGRHRVGDHELALHVRRLHIVDAVDHVQHVHGIHERAGECDVGANVGEILETHAEYPAVLVECQLARVHDVARLLVADKNFRAAADPFDRPAKLLRRQEQRAILGIGVEAHAKPAADLLGHDTHLVRCHAKDRRQLPTHRADALRGGMQVIHFLCRIPGAHRSARFHRIADHPRVIAGVLDHMRGTRKGRVGRGFVPAGVVEDQIARHRVVQLRCACGQRVACAHDGHEILELDRHRFGSVLRLRRGLRNNQREGFAHMPHGSDREGVTRRRALLGIVAPLQRGGSRHRLLSGGDHIGAAEHRDHAGHRQRRRGVDRHNARVRPVRAQKVSVRLSRQIPIGDVASPSLEHALVFEPALVAAK